MHTDEPSLLDHFNKIRTLNQNDTTTGTSTIIYTGKVRLESDMMDVLNAHRIVSSFADNKIFNTL